jgi:large subunit ribosomal protein L10
MKTKEQKKQEIEQGKKYFSQSKTIILTDFTGLSANEMNIFRKLVRELGGVFFVMKKRLLRLVLKENDIDFDTKKLEGQTGVIFSPKDSLETSKLVYNFAKSYKAKKIFKILGGWEIEDKKFLESKDIEMLGQLPSREELLGKLVFMFTVPLKKLVFVLNEKVKKSS